MKRQRNNNERLHNAGVRTLEERIRKDFPRLHVQLGVPYYNNKTLSGKVDVLVGYKNVFLYLEYKTRKGYCAEKKVEKQKNRWLGYAAKFSQYEAKFYPVYTNELIGYTDVKKCLRELMNNDRFNKSIY